MFHYFTFRREKSLSLSLSLSFSLQEIFPFLLAKLAGSPPIIENFTRAGADVNRNKEGDSWTDPISDACLSHWGHEHWKLKRPLFWSFVKTGSSSCVLRETERGRDWTSCLSVPSLSLSLSVLSIQSCHCRIRSSLRLVFFFFSACFRLFSVVVPPLSLWMRTRTQ